jgi:hypothetical protein
VRLLDRREDDLAHAVATLRAAGAEATAVRWTSPNARTSTLS